MHSQSIPWLLMNFEVLELQKKTNGKLSKETEVSPGFYLVPVENDTDLELVKDLEQIEYLLEIMMKSIMPIDERYAERRLHRKNEPEA